MSGVYFHIPFCRQLCHYCAFHKSISLQAKEDMLECLKLELKLRKDYLGDNSLTTIYFGGGTPSVYQANEIESLIEEVAKYFIIEPNAEITLEANPDDLTEKYLQELAKTRVNRLSVGIQSFHDEDLILMNRRHTGKEAFDAIRRAQAFGFDNISVDQIYGVPGLTMEKWKEKLELVFDLNVQHISSYHLMFDPNTIFTKKLEKGQLVEMDEEDSFEQFNYLIDVARKHGFVHYEISNFSKEGYISEHNSSYWKQKKYLGIGPSAHSYNLEQREWNIANNYKYITAIRNNESFSEKEDLSEYDRFNDFVLTSLRTYWGMDLELVRTDFGEKLYQHCILKTKKYLSSEHIRQEKNSIILNDKGVFVSNDIMSDFFWVEEE
ncbi:hypothetical protein BZG02_09405 [Labilibaculum filiforme]|uniref:Heme chaperone HemW n=2 Tax=Labilibaculum filiforme TaxID=1940526 RepID=A0A2N3HZX4_9BACT|nr:hypothetical protein BZG02_09405 [Labilibaculum filiforme]